MKPIVSVAMITYGHENYIEEAINSVLKQECDFDVELIIVNDYSPDNTERIILEILKNHPNSSWIKYIKHKKNLGMMPNFIFALNQCKGKYIAICEGDDYWTDPLKLQKQVDFLNKNHDYVICGTRIKVNIKGTFSDDKTRHTENMVYCLEDVLYKNPFSTCSVVFRNDIPDYEYFDKFYTGDWPLYCYLMKKGKGCVLNFVTAVYNFHGHGVASSLNLNSYLKNRLNDRSLLAKRNETKYKWIIKKHGYRLLFHYTKNTLFLRLDYLKALFKNKGSIVEFIKS